MKLTSLVLTIGLITLTASECKKPKPDSNSDNGLPPATQTGQGIFSCKVNGKPWISRKGLGNIGTTVLKDTLGIHGSLRNNDNSIEDIWINLLSIFKFDKNVYQLNDTLKAYAVYQVIGNNRCINNNPGYGRGGRKKGTDGLMTFTKIDTINKIISGTFSFIVLTDYCDTLNVTDGRFDLKYK